MVRAQEEGSEMSREEELSVVRGQVSILAEQVARLMDVISIRDRAGTDTKPAEEKLELLESLMWKLHRRQTRLKAATAQACVSDIKPLLH
jgi:hypothetical protein